MIDNKINYNVLLNKYKKIQIKKCEICDNENDDFISCYKCCYKFCSDCLFNIFLNYNKVDCPQCRFNIISDDYSIEELKLIIKNKFYKFK